MTPLEELAASVLSRPAPAAVIAMAEHLRRDRNGVAAILGYGSCLRGVRASETLIDLYLLVERNEEVSENPLARFGARLVPPNVYFAQHAWDGEMLRAKYAVMTLEAFARRMRREMSNPYFWARFSQPCVLLYAANETARRKTIAAVATAVETMFAASIAAAAPGSDAIAVWREGFARTYGTELRPETGARAQEIVAANAGFYREAARHLAKIPPLPLSWPRVSMMGKLLSLMRLAKAAFTFVGGADYAAFKIERHTGRKIAVSQWQRRHPLLAGLLMLPKLLFSRALR